MSLLITASLISAIDFYENAPPDWREKAYDGLRNQLARIWKEPDYAVKRGMDFEKKVYDILSDPNFDINKVQSSEAFKEVLVACQGGNFQNKNKTFIEVDGKQYCLFGKEDVRLRDKIIDIKTTFKFNPFKYKGSFQHKLYMYNSGIQAFDYLVVVFKEEVGNEIDRVETIKIRAFEVTMREYAKELIAKIREINKFFEKNPLLKELYETKFSR